MKASKVLVAIITLRKVRCFQVSVCVCVGERLPNVPRGGVSYRFRLDNRCGFVRDGTPTRTNLPTCRKSLLDWFGVPWLCTTVFGQEKF